MVIIQTWSFKSMMDIKIFSLFYSTLHLHAQLTDVLFEAESAVERDTQEDRAVFVAQWLFVHFSSTCQRASCESIVNRVHSVFSALTIIFHSSAQTARLLTASPWRLQRHGCCTVAPSRLQTDWKYTPSGMPSTRHWWTRQKGAERALRPVAFLPAWTCFFSHRS